MTGGPLLVVCALRAERWALLGGARGSDPRPRLLRTGMGPARTSGVLGQALAEPAEDLPGGLVVTGFCAAAVPGFRAGDALVAEAVRDADGTAAELPGAAGLAERLRALGVPARTGLLYSADHVVRGPERERLAADGAHGIDMESAAALRTAPPGLSAAVVRIVVDTPEHELLRPSTLTGGVRAWRALRAVAPAFSAWHRGLPGVSAPATGSRAP